MSNLEEIENFRVTFTQDSSTITSSDSASTILTAHNTGKYVYAVFGNNSFPFNDAYNLSGILNCIFRDDNLGYLYTVIGTTVTKISLANIGTQGILTSLAGSHNHIVFSDNQITLKKEGFTIIYNNKPKNFIGNSDYVFTPDSTKTRQFLCINWDLATDSNSNWNTISDLIVVLDDYFTAGGGNGDPKNYFILAGCYYGVLQSVGCFSSEFNKQKIESLYSKFDNIENTFKYKQIPFNYYNEIEGNNNTYVVAGVVKNIKADRQYKIHIFNTDVDMSGVTMTGVGRFSAQCKTIDGTQISQPLYIPVGSALSSDYTFLAPTNCFQISIGGRCTTGYSLKISIIQVNSNADLVIKGLYLNKVNDYSFTDCSSMGHGSIAPSGGIYTSESSRYSDFLPIYPSRTINITSSDEITYNGTAYILRCRLIVVQYPQANNTIYREIKSRVSPFTDVMIPDGDYHYMRFCIFITTDGTTLVSDSLASEIWQSEVAIPFAFSFSDFVLDKNFNLADLQERIETLENAESTTDIVKLNNPTQTLSYFKNLARQYKGSLTTTRKNLVLAHFSDLHQTRDNLLRILEYCEEYASYIDDILFTGDVVANSYNQITDADYTALWEDAEDVLFTIGNHDTAKFDSSTSTYDWDYYVGLPAYTRYFAPNIANWGVTQPTDAATNGYCYYYKDYTSEKVRLIVLDYMQTDYSAQNTWLQGVLTSAISAGLSVVCAIHAPSPITSVSVSFDSKFSISGNDLPTVFKNSVESFISNGGEFICWLTGHTHKDFFGCLTSNPNQLVIAVDTASSMTIQQQFDNIQRESGKKSQDLFNIFSIDTYNKRLCLLRVGADTDTMLRHIGTLCYDYQNKLLIWND